MRTITCLALFIGLLAFVPAPGHAQGDDFKLEPGFTLLFNGKDLTGWKTKKGGESLDGKAEAYDKRFTVKDGKIIIDPKVKGDVIIETAKPFEKDVTIKFEFMPDATCNNDLFIRGIKFDINSKALKAVKVGEWNQFEIAIAGDKADIKINGEAQKGPAAKAGGTPFGVRAEFGAIEIRRVRAKE